VTSNLVFAPAPIGSPASVSSSVRSPRCLTLIWRGDRIPRISIWVFGFVSVDSLLVRGYRDVGLLLPCRSPLVGM